MLSRAMRSSRSSSSSSSRRCCSRSARSHGRSTGHRAGCCRANERERSSWTALDARVCCGLQRHAPAPQLHVREPTHGHRRHPLAVRAAAAGLADWLPPLLPPAAHDPRRRESRNRRSRRTNLGPPSRESSLPHRSVRRRWRLRRARLQHATLLIEPIIERKWSSDGRDRKICAALTMSPSGRKGRRGGNRGNAAQRLLVAHGARGISFDRLLRGSHP